MTYTRFSNYEIMQLPNTRGTPCVEDITIRVTRLGWAGLRHKDHHVKPSTKLEDGGSIMGLRPGGGLRPVVITRRYGKTCNVRQE